MRSIYVIELSDLYFMIMVLMFNGSSQFCLSLYLSFRNVCEDQHMWYIRLGLITLMNCSSKLFKMVLLSPLWNGIKTGQHSNSNNFFNNILDVQCPLFNSELRSVHPFCDCVAISTHFDFFFFFLSKKTFQLIFTWPCECKYICM